MYELYKYAKLKVKLTKDRCKSRLSGNGVGVKSALQGNSLLLLLNRGLSHCGFYNPFAKRKCFRTFSLTLFELPSYNVPYYTKVFKVIFVRFSTEIVDEYSQLLLRPI